MGFVGFLGLGLLDGFWGLGLFGILGYLVLFEWYRKVYLNDVLNFIYGLFFIGLFVNLVYIGDSI